MSRRLLPLSPERYHGTAKSRPYFEGWYFKQASSQGAFSVIPGLFRGAKEQEDFAFIQVIFSSPSKSYFFRYPKEAFICHPKKFGLICVLRIEDKQYRFATYNGARVRVLDAKDGVVRAELSRGRHRLCVTARSEQFGDLKAPVKTGMDRVIRESIDAVCDISLSCGKQMLYCGTFQHGGLEMHGVDKLNK